MILGVDTGGTFTDFVLFDGRELSIHKVLSTPAAPEQAILQGIHEMGISFDGLHVVHGSTVATNAVLEGKLAKTVFVTNKGLKDMLTIGRQARRELYNLTPIPIQPPVPESHCIEVNGRVSAQGELLQPISAEDDKKFKHQLAALEPEAVAINLLFSFLRDDQECHLESLIENNIYVSRSSSLLPVYREYERGITTWLNAATGPLMQRYLRRLKKALKPATLTIMQSSGDTIEADQAAKKSAHLLLSGPAGGLLGARAMARLSGSDQLMTFDMGGTSSDVALLDGDIRLTDEGRIAGYPVAVPMVDMHTIGAGGGSLAWIDEGGLLQVGPQSAGALPGPACYAHGGVQATVTDANLVLGHLPSMVTLGGSMPLDLDAARQAVQQVARGIACSLEEAARGILDIANEHMAQALKVISIEKGYDPAAFTLVSFGGAGGLHVCDLADALGMTRAMVPVHGGVLSAFGMLVAPRGRRYMKTFMQPLACFDRDLVSDFYGEMEASGRQSLSQEGISDDDINVIKEADIRYIGQSSTIRVDWGERESMLALFTRQHEQRFGHSLEEPLEIVNLHMAVQAQMPAPNLPVLPTRNNEIIGRQWVVDIDSEVDVYDRDSLGNDTELYGPVIIVEKAATTWVKDGWKLRVDSCGNLLLSS